MNRKKKSSKRSPLDETLINLTPLIDVVFVVLIAFIVVAPLLEVENIALYKKKERSSPLGRSDAINIYVRRDNSIKIGNLSVKGEEVFQLLKELKLRDPKKRVFLFHDKRAFFGTYQMIKEAAERAGFERLDLVCKNG